MKNSLQSALDNKDIDEINKFMAYIFIDYYKQSARVLIIYNCKYGINADKLIRFKKLYPKTPYIALFNLEPEYILSLVS